MSTTLAVQKAPVNAPKVVTQNFYASLSLVQSKSLVTGMTTKVDAAIQIMISSAKLAIPTRILREILILLRAKLILKTLQYLKLSKV
tara:strand:- start:239 stop:499 length:261 start_codon:yes stop_codon:yes gene_type:complete